MSEERKAASERTERMRMELESLEVRLEEERKRSADLLLQVALTSKKNRLKCPLYEGLQLDSSASIIHL